MCKQQERDKLKGGRDNSLLQGRAYSLKTVTGKRGQLKNMLDQTAGLIQHIFSFQPTECTGVVRRSMPLAFGCFVTKETIKALHTDMTGCTPGVGGKGIITVMTGTAELTGIQSFHGKRFRV